MTSWTLTCKMVGDSKKGINVAAMEALLYSSAQDAAGYADSSGIPVSFVFGWLDSSGNADDYISYQGFTLKFSVNASGMYLTYTITGYASLSIASSVPALNIPAISGFVQPSAVAEAVAKAANADAYYNLDIDHNDAPTYVSHGALTTSFNNYIRGEYSASDDYSSFPGLLALSKSYSSASDSSSLASGYSLSQLQNNLSVSSLSDYITVSNNDTAPQCTSFSYWVEEPTMTSQGTIHYKSDSNLLSYLSSDSLEYGTDSTNVLSISGSYDGVAYNMSNMNFSQLGFAVDGSGNSVANSASVTNSWSSSIAGVYQSANIINDINALASQFSSNISVTIPGTTSEYTVAQPVSLIVVSGGTLSPITGIYNVTSVTHNISNVFTTTLKLQRMVTSTANSTAASQNITVNGNNGISVDTTPNVISPSKVDLGTIYPNFSDIS